MMEIEKSGKNNRKLIMWVVPILVLVLLIFVLIILNFKKQDLNSGSRSDLETEMKTMVSAYYDANIKGKVKGIHQHIITLEDLQKQDYDISNFIASECKLDSFSYVILKDPNETEIEKIKYEIENHLDCKKETK